LLDANALLKSHRYAGAIYLAGYAVECLLKWAVTSRKALVYLPEQLEIHDWDVLLIAGGLNIALTGDPELSGVFSDLSERWGPELRYSSKAVRAREAYELYQKIIQLYSWIREQGA